MYNSLKDIDDLAAQARKEAAPEIDVTRQVLYQLQSVPPARDWALPLLTASSLITASVVAFIGISIFKALNDPLAPLFELAVNIPL